MRLQDQKLKAVRVYATHSLKFDEDYSLDRLKYSQNAPDLFIIAPLVHFAKPLNVDVSCLSVPDYPEGLAKAKNGVQISENGADGKPGLPGFNGGNLFILADTIQNLDYLSFKSDGGNGGTGQKGGFLFILN